MSKNQWLCNVVQHLDDSDCDYISWVAFHAHLQSTPVRPKANIALLLLFHENANSATMIKHAMVIIKDAIKHLNPSQIPVVAVDQPLYSLANKYNGYGHS